MEDKNKYGETQIYNLKGNNNLRTGQDEKQKQLEEFDIKKEEEPNYTDDDQEQGEHEE